MAERFSQANRVFECAKSVAIGQLRVEHRAFQSFSDGLSTLRRTLGTEMRSDLWKRFLRPLNYYRFDAMAAPLPFNHEGLRGPERVESAQQCLQAVVAAYPDFSQAAKLLTDTLTNLTELSAAPLLAGLESSGDSKDARSTGVVICESRLLESVTEMLGSCGSNGRFRVVLPEELTRDIAFSHLVVVGDVRWYPRWLLFAPRAVQVTLLGYHWTGRARGSQPWFGPDQPGHPILPSAEITQTKQRRPIEPERDWKDLRPGLDLDAIRTVLRDGRSPSVRGTSTELVSARLIELIGDRLFLVESDELTQVWSIDLEDDEDRLLRQRRVTELRSGMFVLVRTVGAGDLVIPIADRLMGSRCRTLRRRQTVWKARLRDAVRKRGLARVARQLSGKGCSAASENNVRRWMSESPHVIGTRGRRDFEVILEFVDLADQRDKYLQSMTLIRRAHRRAGQHVRRQLLRQLVARTDELARGVATFELDEGGGEIAAYRIRTISSDRAMASATRLRRVLTIHEGADVV